MDPHQTTAGKFDLSLPDYIFTRSNLEIRGADDHDDRHGMAESLPAADADGVEFTTMALAAALLVFMLSFQLGVYDTMKANALRIFDGFAQIQPPGYADDPDIRKTIPTREMLAAEVKVPGVTAATPRATSYVVLANGDLSYGAAIEGVDPLREQTVSTLAATVHQGRTLEPADSDAIVLGDALARNLKLSLGDQSRFWVPPSTELSPPTASLWSVSSIAALPRWTGRLPRCRSSASRKPSCSAMPPSHRARRPEPPRGQRRAAGAWTARRHPSPDGRGLVASAGAKQATTLDFSTSMLWYVSLVVVVVFIILNTLLMSVLERTREFGMLLAVGMRAELVGRMLWLEIILLAVLGNAIGILIGGGIALWFGHAGIVFGGMEGLMAQWGLPGGSIRPRASSAPQRGRRPSSCRSPWQGCSCAPHRPARARRRHEGRVMGALRSSGRCLAHMLAVSAAHDHHAHRRRRRALFDPGLRRAA